MAIIIGDGTANVLRGTPASDTIRGGGGADTIFGLARADRLYGETGNDTLEGGDSNDVLDGGAGNDRMRGGRGNDVYVVNLVSDRVEETLAGGAGGLDAVFASIAYTLGANLEKLHLVGFAGAGTGNALDNVITGNDNAETLLGLAGDDTLLGNGGADVLDGGRGADRMEGGEGDDSYYVENAGDVVIERVGGVRGGIDTVFSAVDFTLTGNAENLTLYGAASVGQGNGWANRIVGNAGPDRLVGWGGDDFLEGGPGADRLNGGAGNDTAMFPAISENFFSLDAPGVIADLGAGTMRWVGSSEPVDQLISIESITTGDGDDRIVGSAGNNVISPGNGANLVDAGAGDDVIHGGGWGGLDPNTFEVRTEVLRGGAGDDVINGNGNVRDLRLDELHGGTDVLDGGAGNDRLIAGIGTLAFPNSYRYDGNIMTGGAGADRFGFNDDWVNHASHLSPVESGMGGTVTDFDPGEGDKLILDLDNPSSAAFVGEGTDIGAGECGFYREGADTIVRYGIHMANPEFSGEPYLVAISVKLEDYAGAITAGDVLFV